ncbi:hypothetical protein QBC40DRAFT_302080 [Triangularia verruculosa]|uniref:Uncharacterized protein n=1 Tax=Triangularia verruculosa TaxID=2587418 RepID=A0AAN6X5H5_9PEZI|nr:hypothetical protein QBC40DRAFT_302080 [Triangularia verruculosa]
MAAPGSFTGREKKWLQPPERKDQQLGKAMNTDNTSTVLWEIRQNIDSIAMDLEKTFPTPYSERGQSQLQAMPINTEFQNNIDKSWGQLRRSHNQIEGLWPMVEQAGRTNNMEVLHDMIKVRQRLALPCHKFAAIVNLKLCQLKEKLSGDGSVMGKMRAKLSSRRDKTTVTQMSECDVGIQEWGLDSLAEVFRDIDDILKKSKQDISVIQQWVEHREGTKSGKH